MNQVEVNVDKTIEKITTNITELKSGIKTAKLNKKQKKEIIGEVEELIAMAESMKND